jgi:hypothetical protein
MRTHGWKPRRWKVEAHIIRKKYLGIRLCSSNWTSLSQVLDHKQCRQVQGESWQDKKNAYSRRDDCNGSTSFCPSKNNPTTERGGGKQSRSDNVFSGYPLKIEEKVAMFLILRTQWQESGRERRNRKLTEAHGIESYHWQQVEIEVGKHRNDSGRTTSTADS